MGEGVVLFFHFSFCLAFFLHSLCTLVCFSFILHVLSPLIYNFILFYFFRVLVKKLFSEVSYSNVCLFSRETYGMHG